MEISLSVRFLGKKKADPDLVDLVGPEVDKVLCFKHAVESAIKGESIRIEVDDFSSGNDFRWTSCEEC